MAKLLVALCFLSFLGIAHCAHNFIVEGRVYCDTCRAGFETSATTYIKGARVRLECKDRATQEMTYSIEGVTNEEGTYQLPVADDHEEEICETILVSSPEEGCKKPMPERERARILLTHNNGITSDKRYANALGFLKEDILPECIELLKNYAMDDVMP